MSQEPSGTGGVSRPARKPVRVPNGGARRGCGRSPRPPRAPPHGGHGRGPRGVPGQADLRARAFLGGQRPPAVEPPRLRPGHGLPEPFGAVVTDQDQPGHAGGVHLGDVDGHVVQPLVGEQQPGDALRQVRAPLHPGIQSGRAVGQLDGVRARAGGHLGGQRGEHAGDQLAPARAHVDEVQRVGPAQRLVDPAQQPGHGAREPGRGVHRRTEMARGTLGPPVEALGAVQGALCGRTPAAPGAAALVPAAARVVAVVHRAVAVRAVIVVVPAVAPHARALPSRAVRPAAAPARRLRARTASLGAPVITASTLGSTRVGCGSVLRLTPARISLPYAGLRAAPL